MSFKKTIQSVQKKNTEPEVGRRKIQRNDPCPCGSGKKVKHCHTKFLRK